MPKLTTYDIKHIALLAKLDLTEKELIDYKKQLSEVIKYINNLKKVNTENELPTSQTTGLSNVFKDDKIDGNKTLSQDESLSGSDEVHNGYFKVPGIFEESKDY